MTKYSRDLLNDVSPSTFEGVYCTGACASKETVCKIDA